MRTLGLVTIGQTPRVDLVAELRALLPPCRILEHGALDGLAEHTIAAMAPSPGEPALTTRLADGRAVVYRHDLAEGLVAAAVRRAESAGADVVLLACGGSFGEIEHRKPLLRTEELAQHAVSGLAKGLRIGVLRPLADQVEPARRAWCRVLGTDQLATAVVNPFDAAPGELAAAVAGIADQCDLVVLDCFGFDEQMRAVAAGVFGGPVLLIRSLAARLTAELLVGE
ncbi:AroM family protein [Kutzneria albida]|uniref:AroM family protein n=1 Tax=Kutzneria albida DSM 43870 TaxID=1449976 RepID=W5W931_9PSEU|nr:AroM family protein [Kutzneria albida]AHH97250.1 hypothetical protein KALB_3886 [Kutzneria albida DSM 43870]